MKILHASFSGSSITWEQCPHPTQPAFAFIGRSNVGKSSLINALLGRKKLALTSSIPGKTQLINYFLVNNTWSLVDLPGYGWAKCSKKQRDRWARMVRDYLCYSPQLISIFLLIDSRHLPQRIDLDFANWLGEQKIPYAIVFTKTDRCKKNKLDTHIQAFKSAMLDRWEVLPPFFMTSAVAKQGLQPLLAYIYKYLPTKGLTL